MAFASEVSIESAKAPSMRAKASSWPLASTTEMHCGTFISVAFAIAALSSLNAPSDVSFSDGVVSGMGTPRYERAPQCQSSAAVAMHFADARTAFRRDIQIQQETGSTA